MPKEKNETSSVNAEVDPGSPSDNAVRVASRSESDTISSPSTSPQLHGDSFGLPFPINKITGTITEKIGVESLGYFQTGSPRPKASRIMKTLGLSKMTVGHDELANVEPVFSSVDRTKFDLAVSDLSSAIQDVESELKEEKLDLGYNEQDEMVKPSHKDLLYQEFEDWLLENGAVFPDLYLKSYSNDVRGVHCSKRVDIYETVLSIPHRCLITDYMGKHETAIGRKLFTSGVPCTLSTPNLIAVIVYILTTRRDPDHFFQPYYRILPKSYENFPIFWNEEKLAWLEGSPMLEDIAERKRNMFTDYEEICRLCPEFNEFSFEEFLEIRTAVGSRNFGIVVNGEKRTAMVPYADMLNHFRPRETSWTFENSRNAFTITAITPLKPGQQVMDSYGKKCNSKFFLHYGFAVERNREDDGKCQNELLFRFCVSTASKSFRHNEVLTEEERLAQDHEENKLLHLSHIFNLSAIPSSSKSSYTVSKAFRLTMNHDDKSTVDALTFLRIKVATREELAQMKKDITGTSFISLANEKRMLEKLAQYCARQLRRYANTMPENLTLLASGSVPPFSDRRTALVVILGEQEICHFWCNAARLVGSIVEEREVKHVDNRAAAEKLRQLPRTNDNEKDLWRYASWLSDKLIYGQLRFATTN